MHRSNDHITALIGLPDISAFKGGLLWIPAPCEASLKAFVRLKCSSDKSSVLPFGKSNQYQGPLGKTGIDVGQEEASDGLESASSIKRENSCSLLSLLIVPFLSCSDCWSGLAQLLQGKKNLSRHNWFRHNYVYTRHVRWVSRTR